MTTVPGSFSKSDLLQRLFSVLVAVALSSCAQSGPTDSPPTVATDNQTPLQANDCPAYETRNWRAWIEPSGDSAGTGRLNISGQIDLPSPGYSIDFTIGSIDRRNPPSLRINVAPMPPDGAALAVITAEDVRYSIETSVLHYQSILILCGNRQLAELLDIVPTE